MLYNNFKGILHYNFTKSNNYSEDIMNLFGLNVGTLLGRAFFLLAIMPIHEYAHAWMASKMGDNTARYSGRLDLNPLKHLDPLGSILILFTGFGWARPVPINSNNFYDRKKGIFLTALAGPAANILLSLVMVIIYKFMIRLGLFSIVLDIIFTIMQTSVFLAVFNLLPIPPLDGWNMVSVFLPHELYYKVMRYQREISFVFFALIMFTNIISVPLSFLSTLIIRLLDTVTFFI